MHNLDWQDLKYVLSLASSGSVKTAADALGVNRTTVLRRIKRLERELNCPLFERRENGYAVTVEAEQLLDSAKNIEQTVVDLQRRIAGRELKLEGDIRVTTTDALLMSTVTPHLATFSRRHPSITVEVALTNQRLNLTRREADVAIRPLEQHPRPLIGHKLTSISFGVYATPAYLNDFADRPLTEHRWLGVDEPLHTTPVARWLDKTIPKDRIVYRAGSFVALRLAAECDVGMTVLPTLLGDTSEHLVQFLGPLEGIHTSLWIVTHADLAKTPRIRAFVDHFIDAFADEEVAAVSIKERNR